MKYFIIAILFAVATAANAGMWENISSLADEDVELKAKYNVPAKGWNLRVYEWTPAANPDYRCLFAAGEQKGGPACYPVKK